MSWPGNIWFGQDIYVLARPGHICPGQYIYVPTRTNMSWPGHICLGQGIYDICSVLFGAVMNAGTGESCTGTLLYEHGELKTLHLGLQFGCPLLANVLVFAWVLEAHGFPPSSEIANASTSCPRIYIYIHIYIYIYIYAHTLDKARSTISQAIGLSCTVLACSQQASDTS